MWRYQLLAELCDSLTRKSTVYAHPGQVVCRHQLFVHMVQKNRSTAELPSDSSAPEEAAAPDLVKSDSGRLLGRKPTRPAEMPVYSKSASYAHS